MRTYSNPAVEYYADRFVALGLKRLGFNLLQYFANPKRCEARARYEQLRLARHGMSFDEFLVDPERGERLALEPEPPSPAQHAAILRIWAGQDTGLAARPGVAAQPPQDPPAWRELLDEWRAAQAEVERDIAHLPQRNGAYVEPLHHHRRPAHNVKAAHFSPSKRGA